MTRKRFVKLLMGLGYQRNIAAALSQLLPERTVPTYAGFWALWDDVESVKHTKCRVKFTYKDGSCEERTLV